MFAVTAAAVVYVVVNHLLIGVALVLARGVSLRESGVLESENLLTDFIMVCLGAVVALLWELDPWLTLLALSPLVLIYRALMIPQLKQEARVDGKTGLWNARHFSSGTTTSDGTAVATSNGRAVAQDSEALPAGAQLEEERVEA